MVSFALYKIWFSVSSFGSDEESARRGVGERAHKVPRLACQDSQHSRPWVTAEAARVWCSVALMLYFCVSPHPVYGVRGIMFLGGLSICACVCTYMHASIDAQVAAFSIDLPPTFSLYVCQLSTFRLSNVTNGNDGCAWVTVAYRWTCGPWLFLDLGPAAIWHQVCLRLMNWMICRKRYSHDKSTIKINIGTVVTVSYAVLECVM